MKIGWIVMLAALGCGACSDDGDDSDGSKTAIVSGPLTGLVGGKAWSFVSGQTDAFLSEDDSNYWGEAYSETSTCSSGFVDSDYLILNVPKQPGDYALGSMLTATFALPENNDNLIAMKGHIVVDEVSASTIRGGAFIEFDAQNSVNGHFELAICP